MDMSAIETTPRTEMRMIPALDARHGSGSGHWWGHPHRSAPAHHARAKKSLMLLEGYRKVREDRRKHLARFFSYFSGPIVWALEVAAVLLIIVFHTADFVSVVVIANLTMIVMMMAFKAGLGLWHESHPSDTDDDALNRHPAS